MECQLYIDLQIPINSKFVIISLVQELHVNTADTLSKKIFHKYLSMVQWCFHGIFTKSPKKIGPGATFFLGI